VPAFARARRSVEGQFEHESPIAPRPQETQPRPGFILHVHRQQAVARPWPHARSPRRRKWAAAGVCLESAPAPLPWPQQPVSIARSPERKSSAPRSIPAGAPQNHAAYPPLSMPTCRSHTNLTVTSLPEVTVHSSKLVPRPGWSRKSTRVAPARTSAIPLELEGF